MQHPNCRILRGETTRFEACAEVRRTKSVELAKKIKSILLSIETINFEDLVGFRAEAAAELAISTGIRGMDALVVQTAKENNSLLISLDQEMLTLIKGKVSTRDLESLV